MISSLRYVKIRNKSIFWIGQNKREEELSYLTRWRNQQWILFIINDHGGISRFKWYVLHILHTIRVLLGWGFCSVYLNETFVHLPALSHLTNSMPISNFQIFSANRNTKSIVKKQFTCNQPIQRITNCRELLFLCKVMTRNISTLNKQLRRITGKAWIASTLQTNEICLQRDKGFCPKKLTIYSQKYLPCFCRTVS